MILNPTDGELAQVATGFDIDRASVDGPNVWPFAEATSHDVTVRMTRTESDQVFLCGDVADKQILEGMVSVGQLDALIEAFVSARAKLIAR